MRRRLALMDLDSGEILSRAHAQSRRPQRPLNVRVQGEIIWAIGVVLLLTLLVVTIK
jgi:hypothetical protein